MAKEGRISSQKPEQRPGEICETGFRVWMSGGHYGGWVGGSAEVDRMETDSNAVLVSSCGDGEALPEVLSSHMGVGEAEGKLQS